MERESVPEFSIAFIEKQRGAMWIVAVDEEALKLGIGPGMMLADARARVPDLKVLPHDPAANAALLGEIAEDMDRYTPSVALDPPDGLILDITGCAHLWENEADLVSDLAARLAHAGFTLRLALAETPDKARALARHGGELIAVNRRVPPNQLNEDRAVYIPPPLQGRGWGRGVSTSSLSEVKRTSSTPHPDPSPEGQGLQLPIAALDLPEDQLTALRRAGLYTIEDLASRPRKPFAARFGEAAVAKLARVLGEEDICISPRRALPALFVLQRFAEPVARTDYIRAVLHQLGEEAAIALRERGEGGRRFTASLFRSDGDTRRLTIETGGATRDPALLDRLFAERIEALADPLDPGFGYDCVRLDVESAEPLAPEQAGLDGEVVAGAKLSLLIDRLSTRLGPRRVQRFAAGDTHIPEQAAYKVAATAPALPLPWPAPAPDEPPMRPLLLFDPPQPVEVIAEVPDGPPRRFRWRRQTHDVVAHEGPERIASEWWRKKQGHEAGKGGLTRDYYRVEDCTGKRFWLFRHGLYGSERAMPGWYLHGRFV